MLDASLSNDLGATAVALRPELARTLKAGQTAGALAGMLCGTGATTAFLAADSPGANRIANRLLASGVCTSALCRTRSRTWTGLDWGSSSTTARRSSRSCAGSRRSAPVAGRAG